MNDFNSAEIEDLLETIKEVGKVPLKYVPKEQIVKALCLLEEYAEGK